MVWSTRLRKVISEYPKPMAEVNGKPFLHYVFLYLQKQGIRKVILSVGYKLEVIKSYFGLKYLDIEILYCEENEPLGTFGAIYHATMLCDVNDFILNGDTFFDVDLQQLANFHFEKQTKLSVALKPLKNFDRYGTVKLDAADRITEFAEKKFMKQGLINGGVYLLNKDIFEKVMELEKIKSLPLKFSFEKDILEKHLRDIPIYGDTSDHYFVDIGIPEDYTKAQIDFRTLF